MSNSNNNNNNNNNNNTITLGAIQKALEEIGIVNSSGGIRTMQNLHFLDRPPFAERSLKIKTRRNFL